MVFYYFDVFFIELFLLAEMSLLAQYLRNRLFLNKDNENKFIDLRKNNLSWDGCSCTDRGIIILKANFDFLYLEARKI